MPENDQPMWPSSDEDRSSSAARKTTPTRLPDSPAGPADRTRVPKVTSSEAPNGSWFAPNVEPEPIPGLNAPAEPAEAPPKQDLADRLGGTRPPKSQDEGTQQLPLKPPGQPQPSQQPGRPPGQAQQSQQPGRPPWVPVERNVWAGDQQESEPEEPQNRREPQYGGPQEERREGSQQTSGQLFGEDQQQPSQQARADQQRGQGGRQQSGQKFQQSGQLPNDQRRDGGQQQRGESGRLPSGQQFRDEQRGGQRGEQPGGQRDDSRGGQPSGQQRWDGPPPVREDQVLGRDDWLPRAGEQGLGEVPWTQRLDVRDERRAGLPPEPPRGVVPSASEGSLARPVRIEPDGRRFDAEATVVNLERPTQFPGAFQQQPQPRNEPPVEPPAAEPPADAAGQEPPKKKRKGKLILIGALVLVVLAGLGGAAAVPKVANRLALPWAPNAPKSDTPEPAAAVRQLQGPATAGPVPTATGIKSALASAAGNSALGQLTGNVVDPVSGTSLWDRNSASPVTPASTTKVLTSAAALLSLDPNTRLSTKVVQGADPGTVILVGGGDTTLTALPIGTESPLYPGAAHVDDLVAQVKKANPAVKKVQVDLSLFKGPTTASGWAPGDAPSTFATQLAPVMADGGRTNPKDNNSQRTGNAGSALAGTIASKLGASAAGQAAAPPGAKVLAEVKSAPLTELVSDLMELSDDVLSEAIARQVAIAGGQEASFTGGAAATLKVLKDHGFETGGVQLSDGSGISVQNKIPAKLLTQVLTAAAGPDGKHPDTAKLRALLAGLPVAGGSGTLADKRFNTAASQGGRGWVRAKTGTLTGVNTLAGLVLDQDGRVLVFAFMSNGSDTDAGRAGLDVLAASLRKCGCA